MLLAFSALHLKHCSAMAIKKKKKVLKSDLTLKYQMKKGQVHRRESYSSSKGLSFSILPTFLSIYLKKIERYNAQTIPMAGLEFFLFAKL